MWGKEFTRFSWTAPSSGKRLKCLVRDGSRFHTGWRRGWFQRSPACRDGATGGERHPRSWPEARENGGGHFRSGKLISYFSSWHWHRNTSKRSGSILFGTSQCPSQKRICISHTHKFDNQSTYFVCILWSFEPDVEGPLQYKFCCFGT